MGFKIYNKKEQAHGVFNGGEIVENKPLGFPQDGGELKPYSNLFYWANAEAREDSTIGLHPHQGFEIMSFVLAGTIKHFDTKMNAWKELKAGDVQIIRAGNGIKHAEFMAKGSRMFQIWVDPDLNKTLQKEASYSDYKSEIFSKVKRKNLSRKIYIGENSPFDLDTLNFKVELWNLDGPNSIITSENYYSIYVLDGEATLQGKSAKIDDFILINPHQEIEISGTAELFVIMNKAELDYQTYAKRFA